MTVVSKLTPALPDESDRAGPLIESSRLHDYFLVQPKGWTELFILKSNELTHVELQDKQFQKKRKKSIRSRKPRLRIPFFLLFACYRMQNVLLNLRLNNT